MKSQQSIDYFKKSNIMLLPGVYVSKLAQIDDIFDQKILSEISGRSSITMNDNSVGANNWRNPESNPNYFVSKEQWKQRNDGALCWWCTLQFENAPVPIVTGTSITDKGEEVLLPISGSNCCDIYCAQAYIDKTYYGTDLYDDCCKFLRIVHRKMTGKTVDYIHPAPPHTIMVAYCGAPIGITPQEYKNLKESQVKDYELVNYKASQIRVHR